MAVDKTAGVTPEEHPLMSNKTLRAMYTRMVRVRAMLEMTRGKKPGIDDVACWVSILVGLNADDVTFGCRKDGALAIARGGSRESGHDVVIEGGLERLYAGVSAAMAVGGSRIVVAFFERHEVEKSGWIEALRLAKNLPLILVILPRWKGQESERDLSRESRAAGVPGIPVDGHDGIALYRVAQESIGRARAHGGAALIEGVRFHLAKAAHEQTETADAVEGLGEYLLLRGVAKQSWMDAIASQLPKTDEDRIVSSGEREGTLSGNPKA